MDGGGRGRGEAVRPCEEGEGSAPSGTCALGCTLSLMDLAGQSWSELCVDSGYHIRQGITQSFKQGRAST